MWLLYHGVPLFVIVTVLLFIFTPMPDGELENQVTIVLDP